MLETWRRFNAAKVTRLLRQHRKVLECELRAIERLLATPNDTDVAAVAGQLKTLRQH